MREPAWEPEEEVVLALGEVRRVVWVDTSAGRRPGTERRSENLDLRPEEPELAYLPRPRSGRISTLDTGRLQMLRGYDVRDSPTHVTLDVQPEILFALAENGSTRKTWPG